MWASWLEVRPALAQNKDQIAPTLSSAHRGFATVIPRGKTIAASRHGQQPLTSTAAFDSGVDSIRNFTGEFQVSGLDAAGNQQRRWLFTMAGGNPEAGGTTSLNAPVVPVSLDLLDYGGQVRVVNGHPLHYSVRPFVGAVVDSPVFQKADYSSSETPTQFADAVQRAEFYNQMQTDWHTLLKPVVKTERTMSIPRGAYFFALNADGSCCAFVLVDIRFFSKLLLPSTVDDSGTLVGTAEHAKDIATADISTFLSPTPIYISTATRTTAACWAFTLTIPSPAMRAISFARSVTYLIFRAGSVLACSRPGLKTLPRSVTNSPRA